jgi:hypothetical protein
MINFDENSLLGLLIMLTQPLQWNLDNFFWEIDHILLFTHTKVEISILQEFGLNCSRQIIRRSEQGTTSIVIFFENIYLEIVWIENRDCAEQYSKSYGIDILTHSNWEETGSSPFGIGLRTKTEKANIKSYLKNLQNKNENLNVSAKFSNDNLSQIEEPIFFLVPDELALTTWLDYSFEQHQQLITHPLGVKKLTKLKVGLDTHKKLTSTICLLEQNQVLYLQNNSTPLLELTFDNCSQEQVIDTQPLLPIRIRF